MISYSSRRTSAADAKLFHPLDRDPEVIEEACIGAVQRWPIKAIGRRPPDWIAHDLLFFRMLRDSRPHRQHDAIRHPAGWIRARVKHLAGADSGIASPHVRGIQLTVLHYFHLWQLYHAHDWILDDQLRCDPPHLLRRWQRLWDCQPCGAEYARRSQPRTCGMVQLCPWCRARLGVRLWRRLQDGLAPNQSEQLVILRWQVTSQWISCPFFVPGYGSSSSERDKANRWHTQPDADDPRDSICAIPPPGEDWQLNPGDMYARLTSRQMEAARTKLNTQLDDWASRLGLKEGCKFYIVEPAVRITDDDIQYRQHIWWGYLIAPIATPCPNPKLWNELKNTTIYPTEYRADERKVLGTGPLRRTLTEVMGWPSLCLFDSWQWWHYHSQTIQRQLYVPFGRWRQLLAEPAKHDAFVLPPPRLIALRRSNGRRHKTAAVQLDRLLAIARPLWKQIQANPGPPRRGRPAHRSRLREMLAEQGTVISDWHLRNLIEELTKNVKGDGL